MSNMAILQWLNHRFPRIETFLPRTVKRSVLIHFAGVGRGYTPPPSRQWLERDVLPRLPRLGFRNTLFVGVAPYTRHYERAVRQSGGNWVTVDSNPSADVWGAPVHIEAPIQQIHLQCAPASFDAVILNGVFGFGVNTVLEMNRSIQAIRHVLKPAGLLLIGWNKDLGPDPLALIQIQKGFLPVEGVAFPARREFADETHVYDFLVSQPVQGNATTA
jgi:hypothetical protein